MIGTPLPESEYRSAGGEEEEEDEVSPAAE